MGYTTDFEGEVKINKQIDDETFKLLQGLCTTRRMKRAGLPVKYGVEGEFFVEDREDLGMGDPSQGRIVNSNYPPKTQPGLWCDWEIQEDRKTIMWNGGEKFYNYVQWLEYIIEKILKPRGYIVNGSIRWRGEEFRDLGIIIVKDNKVMSKSTF